MPRLHIEGDDLHYTVKTFRGGHETWQATDGAIAYLKKKGITIPKHLGDVSDFSRSLFDDMVQRGLLYTKKEHQRGRGEHGTYEEMSQRHLELMMREKHPQGWELAISFLQVPAWNRSLSQQCTLKICDPNTFYNREQRLLATWTQADIRAGRACVVEPISGKYGIDVQGRWSTDSTVQQMIHNINGLDADGTLFHDDQHKGWRLAGTEVIYPGRTYYFVAREATPLPTELKPRSLGLWTSPSPYPSFNKWQAWKITIPENVNEFTSEKINAWREQIGHPLRELPWRLALLSPPPVAYTSKGHPILENRSRVVIEVLPPTDPLQGAESVEIEIKRNGMPYMPPSEPIRTHRMLSFTLKRRGYYRISGVNGLARPLTLRVNPSDLNMPSDPEPLTIQLTTSTQQYKYAAYGEVSQASKEQVIEIEHFGVGDVPVCAVHCPVPVTVTWTCGDEYKQQRSQINDASKIDNHVNSLLVFAWKRREALSFVMDAGSFGRLSLSIRPRALPQQQEPSSQTLPTSQRSPYLLQRIQWLSEEAMKAQGDEVVMVPVPFMVQTRLKKLKSVPEYAHLMTMTQFPQGLLPHLCALTKMLQYEEDKLSAQ